MQHDARDREVDDQAAHLNEGDAEGRGRARRIEPAAAQDERDELSIGECYNPYTPPEKGAQTGQTRTKVATREGSDEDHTPLFRALARANRP